MPFIVGALLGILLIGLLLRRLRQPHVVGYLLAGIALGPHALALIRDETVLGRLGAFGVVILLFFIGMEVSPRRLVANWKVAVVGTVFQIAVSVACVLALGAWLGWSWPRSILLGFVISLSSTAVVLKILQDWGELDSAVGQDVLGILLVQDLAVIPMLLVMGLMGGAAMSTGAIVMQVLGGMAILGLLAWIVSRESIHLPFSRWLQDDAEMQIFAAFILCFGLALLTGVLGLSTALGAFAAGLIIAAARETQWVHHSLEPFRVVFVALFFVSIGMLVDVRFLLEHWLLVSALVLATLITNTFINATVLRLLGDQWRESFYAGALLSQIGEFSFVLAAIGLEARFISQYGYQLAIAVISMSLVLSPAWIMLFKHLLNHKPRSPSIA
jgi:CPA2 family monovalent cation:H+ antiporter-2